MELLDGVIRDYPWGARGVIADLQGRTPPGGPEAELWLGAHPSAPAVLRSGATLDAVVAADPEAVLGPVVSARSGGFPFLLKVLAAAEPLSIQAHPSLDQARAGYEREQAAGVPVDDPTRTYRDANHKPELICALTRFEALCGFRPLAATRALVADLAVGGETGVVELQRRLAGPADADRVILGDVMGWLVGLDGPDRKDLVSGLVTAARSLLGVPADPTVGHLPVPDDRDRSARPELWWTIELDRRYPGDVGVVVALLLNHVVLEPGQAVFLAAGNLHAYLEGAGVELMASSDNVVRGGLTPKHVDAEELVRVLDTGPGPAPIQTPVSPLHRFDSPVEDFSLTRVVGDAAGLDVGFEPVGPEILLVTGGAATVTAGPGPALDVPRGGAVLIPWSDGSYRVRSDGPVTVWRAAAGGDDGSSETRT